MSAGTNAYDQLFAVVLCCGAATAVTPAAVLARLEYLTGDGGRR